MKKFTMLLICLSMFGIYVANAQQRTITGTVTSSEDNMGLPGVSVTVKGTTIGAATDIDGKYVIKVPQDAQILVFSSVGMAPQEITIGASNSISVVMKPSTVDLGDVVVIGYGTTKKSSFTGAATTIDKDLVAKKAEANPIKALEATVPGLQMNTSTGQPGAPSTVYIRGKSSINSGTQPLYVIDGIPIESGTWGMRSDEGQSTTPLSGLNPSDIETITVLKDATATSIYGARAANGVIVITTKSAKKGSKTKITYDNKVGWEELPSYTDKYKLLGKDKYLDIMGEGAFNCGWFGLPSKEEAKKWFLTSPTPWDLSGYDLIGNAEPADVDWMKEITRKGFIHEHNVSVQAAGDKETSPLVYFSFGYMDNDAFIRGKDFQKTSMRLNFSQKLNSWFKYGMNTSLAYSKTNLGSGGGYFSDPITQAYMQSPITPVKNEDGEWNFSTVNGYNPVAQRSEFGDKSRSQNYRAILSPYVLFDILPGLTFKSTAGLDFMNIHEFGYWSFLQPQGNDMRGMGEFGTDKQTMLTVNNVLNYIKGFGQGHNLNVMLGQETQSTNQYSSYLAGSNYPVDNKNYVSLASTPSSASTSEYQLRLASFFTSVQYDFNSKYFLSGSFRYDGSSRFGDNHKWAPFWSVGAKYRLSADIAEGSDWLNNLMIRTSYGTSGNQVVGNSWYAARPLYSYGFNYNSNGGSIKKQPGNPDLKWEQLAKFNAGIDVRVLNNRIDFTFDYYHHSTIDMVFDMPISRATGVSKIPTNIGKMNNSGIELSLGADVVRTEDIKLNLKFVASHNKNEVKKLSTEFPIEKTFTIIEAGYDVFTFKMKEFAGVNPDNGNPLYYKNETGDETTENYNLAAKRYLGSGSPKWQGSFSSLLEAYGFDFSMQFNYMLGRKVYGSNLRYDEQTGNSYNQAVTNYVYDNRWQKPGDQTDVPKFTWGSKSAKHSSRFLMDGDYLKIQNLMLGYTLPKDLTEKVKLSRVRVFATAQNIYTFVAKNYRGFDPSGIRVNGVQWWNYPQPRKFLFGVNVNF